MPPPTLGSAVMLRPPKPWGRASVSLSRRLWRYAFSNFIQGYVQYYFAYFTFHVEKSLDRQLMIGQRTSCILYPIVAHALFSTRYSISSFLVPIPNVPVQAQLSICKQPLLNYTSLAAPAPSQEDLGGRVWYGVVTIVTLVEFISGLRLFINLCLWE